MYGQVHNKVIDYLYNNNEGFFPTIVMFERILFQYISKTFSLPSKFNQMKHDFHILFCGRI